MEIRTKIAWAKMSNWTSVVNVCHLSTQVVKFREGEIQFWIIDHLFCNTVIELVVIDLIINQIQVKYVQLINQRQKLSRFNGLPNDSLLSGGLWLRFRLWIRPLLRMSDMSALYTRPLSGKNNYYLVKSFTIHEQQKGHATYYEINDN